MNEELSEVHVSSKPAWLAPALIAIVVLGIALAAKKKEEASENALVDLVIIAVGVAAIWAVARKIFIALDAPGIATFFGAPVQPHPDHPSTVEA
jgi:hypothetical protein